MFNDNIDTLDVTSTTHYVIDGFEQYICPRELNISVTNK